MPLPKAPTHKGSMLKPSDTTEVMPATAPLIRKKSTESAAVHNSTHLSTQATAPSPVTQEQRKTTTPAHSHANPTTTRTDAEPAHNTKTNLTPQTQEMPQSGRVRSNKHKEHTKLFVLDTNVLLHDPSSIFRFEEHDVYLPLITLEELDDHKKGMTETARNGRTVSRLLDQLISTHNNGIESGVSLNSHQTTNTHPLHTLGKLFVQTQLFQDKLPKALPIGKADNQILGIVHALQLEHPKRDVVLVSKDINMRIKARALGLNAEDYFNDQVLEDSDILYTGQLALPLDFWEHHSNNLESWQEGPHTYYRIQGPLTAQMVLNQYVYYDHPDSIATHCQVIEIDHSSQTATLCTLIDYTNPKHGVWGIGARNREQNFALNILMNPEIDFVTLLGPAGTGKTLLAIAAALQQTLEMGRFSEVIITRVTMPVGEDIGFLPGSEEEKMTPWMGALQDNLEILIKGDANAGEWQRAATSELIKNKVKIKAMSFMRGRTFINKLLIIDEAQNLTPKQMKTLITRAGPGTKVICMGNLAQIDTPYLSEGSSGLTYVVEHFKSWQHGAHITLNRGERSRLADFANSVL